MNACLHVYRTVSGRCVECQRDLRYEEIAATLWRNGQSKE